MQIAFDMTPVPADLTAPEAVVVNNHSSKFRSGFLLWVLDNLHVVRGFADVTDALRMRGKRHWASSEIMYYLRMETALSEMHSTWKINQNHARDLATLYVLTHPGSDEFFRFKKSRADDRGGA